MILKKEFELPEEEETETRKVCITIGKEAIFEQAFAEAVGEGLEYISESVAPVLRIYLSDAMSVDIGLIKSRLNTDDADALEKGLEKILGFGARIFEKKMLLSLQAKLGLQCEIERNFGFSKEVKKIRNLYERKIVYPRTPDDESTYSQDEASSAGEG